jgi:glycosyltransferase involved in cell wall biosynthesis
LEQRSAHSAFEGTIKREILANAKFLEEESYGARWDKKLISHVRTWGSFSMRMLALMKYGDKAASTRQRLLQYTDHFARQGIEIAFFPLLANDYLERTYGGKAIPLFSVLKSYLSRVKLLVFPHRFDLIWVQYESFPYLPGLAESLVVISGRPVVYDFDDAIFHQYDAHPNRFVRSFLGKKLEPLLRRASLCICGNAYLKAYAGRFSRRTEVVPTVLDTAVFAPRVHPRDTARPITVGWIGSPSTWSFVLPLIPLLERLSEELSLIIRVVGSGQMNIAHSRFEFIDWSKDGEVESIQGMDIGIMPLADGPWARGKCGYKLIQYMACGIPVVASPIGVNSDIVDDGVNGYLARDEREWEAAIRRLIASEELRSVMGACGREKIVEEYSLHVHGPRLARMLREVVDARGL